MRRIPFDPPWSIVPILALIVGAAAVASNGGSLLITYALGMLATLCATLAMDRWFERYRPRERGPRR
jgi:cytochrome c biogenesis protein CcdA